MSKQPESAPAPTPPAPAPAAPPSAIPAGYELRRKLVIPEGYELVRTPDNPEFHIRQLRAWADDPSPENLIDALALLKRCGPLSLDGELFEPDGKGGISRRRPSHEEVTRPRGGAEASSRPAQRLYPFPA